MRRRCGVGCWRKGCGAACGNRKSTGSGGKAKEYFGELVQMDGSFHKWFEQRGPEGCLMSLVDDATGRRLGQLGAQETIWAAGGVLRRWIEKYGVPVGRDWPVNRAIRKLIRLWIDPP